MWRRFCGAASAKECLKCYVLARLPNNLLREATQQTSCVALPALHIHVLVAVRRRVAGDHRHASVWYRVPYTVPGVPGT